MREYIGMNHHGRPKIIESRRAKNVEITGVTFKNSPYYHIDIRDCENIYIHDLEIFVDYWGDLEFKHILGGTQEMDLIANTLDLFELPSLHLPTFPLNTDGLELAGKNILVERVEITCFDDAVAIKPQDN